MIELIELKFGESLESPPLKFTPGAVTVFVGPNNSGKSFLLREIETMIRDAGNAGSALARLEYKSLSNDEVDALLSSFSFSAVYSEDDTYLNYSLFNPLQSSHSVFSCKAGDRDAAREQIGFLAKFTTLRLDGKARFQILENAEAHTFNSQMKNVLSALFYNDPAREQLRSLLHEAFNLYFVIDPTGLRNFRICFSPRPPADAAEERGLDQRAISYHESNIDIGAYSDGVKAYTGILATVLCAGARIILIDEPEAFLHPTLSRRLGKELAKLASSRTGNIIAATHSADFLMGCIQSGKSVDIVRMTYRNSVPTARMLPSESLKNLIKEPLIRSTGALASLFHNAVIVCEGDVDRTLYEEINERLKDIGEGVTDSIFLRAMNKQTVKRLVQPLRMLGIPAAAIVDLDIIKEGDLSSLLRSALVPDVIIDSLNILKNNLLSSYRSMEQDPKKVGIKALSPEMQAVANSLFDQASEYGVFIVPVGEVEKWLFDLAAPGTKVQWLIEILNRLGDDPDSDEYIRPTDDDIWQFMRNVAKWVLNPQKGLPV